MWVSPTPAAKPSIHVLYDACSAAVGSRLQASSSHGSIRKIEVWTRTSGSPPVVSSMYFRTRSVMSPSGCQWPNQVAFGRWTILSRRACCSAPAVRYGIQAISARPW